ncbi:metallophosphoesterase [Paenibacillus aurantius]|uniref:Metallophosphoesterase n=1 Tax=Paenibacillus aurantius TaxID=2918900 RepID=A0AA96LCC5_9BACL|nr:metallophosphoesterase [Paenibacillus aurantius]WNQ11394.1 metallophosphoesterase [Paenibacillus aurantius]
MPTIKKKLSATPTLFETSRRRLNTLVRQLKNPNEFTFIGMGDSWAGDGQTSNTVFRLVLQAIRGLKRKPLFILHSGDSVFTGTAQEFKTGGVYSGLKVSSILQLIQDPARGVPDIPFFIVPGNHDQTGINGPLDNFRKYIGPTHWALHYPKIRTSLIGVSNITNLGGPGQEVYGFPPGELNFLDLALTAAQPNAILSMHVPPRVGKWANPNYFQDPTSTFGNKNGQLNRFLKIVEDRLPLALVGHVHAFDTLSFQGTRYVLSGGAGAPLVKAGFLKGTITPIFHFVEFTVRNGKVVKRRIVPVGFTA